MHVSKHLGIFFLNKHFEFHLLALFFKKQTPIWYRQAGGKKRGTDIPVWGAGTPCAVRLRMTKERRQRAEPSSTGSSSAARETCGSSGWPWRKALLSALGGKAGREVVRGGGRGGSSEPPQGKPQRGSSEDHDGI